MRRNQNFESFFSRKFRCPLIFYLLRSLLSASFAFLSPFFSFVGHLLGKRFCKKFEDREFFLKEVRVGSGTRFSLEFSGYTVFLRLSLVCFAKSRSTGYGLKDLISLHKLVVKVV